MFKQWFAFSKRDIAYVALSAFFALSTSAAEKTVASLPTVSLVFSQKAEKGPRVGDVISYELQGGEPRWKVDPKEGSLKKGFLFRSDKLFIPLVAGKYQIPALTVTDDVGTPVAKTDPVEIEAISNLKQGGEQKEQPKPDPAIGPLGLPFPVWIQSLAGIALLGLVLIGGFFLIRAIQRRAARALKSILPKKPYDLLILDRLDGLSKQGVPGKLTYKAFYFVISESLKFYLAERFQFDAQESTTSELMSLLKDRSGTPGLNESVIQRIEKIFNTLDPVKFANVIPTEADATAILRETREVILSTRKQPEVRV